MTGVDHRPPSRQSFASRKAAALVGLLSSRQFAILLLSLLLTGCFLAVLIPQQPSQAHAEWQARHPRLAEAAGAFHLDAVFGSPLFVVLALLTGLSAAASIRQRFRLLRPGQVETSLPNRLLARRRLLGSLIFHAGLVGIIGAGVLSALTRSQGTVCITEGQVLAVSPQHLTNTQPPRVARLLAAPFAVRLDRFHAVHAGTWGTPDYASELTVMENGRPLKQTTVRVNQPLSHRGVTLYQSRHGYSPQICLLDREGRMRFGSWVALQSDVESQPVRYYDEFMIPGTSLFVRAELFPDAYLEGNRLRNRSPDPRNCLLEVAVSQGTNKVYEGTIPMGQSVELESGLRFGFLGVRRWTGLDLVQDRGAGALFISAWVALLGICLRFAPNLERLGERLMPGKRAAA